MAEHTSQQDDRMPDTGDGPISPIDFQPPDPRRRPLRRRLRLASVVLGGALVLVVAAAWFVLTAKSVYLDVQPRQADIAIDSPLALRIGPRYLMREGEVPIRVTAAGYYPLETRINIGQAQAQSYEFELLRLPGFLDLDTAPVTGARVLIDGEEVGRTPLRGIELAAGEHHLYVERERYQPRELQIDIEGRQVEQSLDVTLQPAWATVSFSSTPPGATVLVDGEEIGNTPLQAELLEGRREVLIKLARHKAWTDTLEVEALQTLALPPVELQPADGLVLLQSTPSNAGVMLNGSYQGQTPLEISVAPEQAHELTFFRNGYREARRQLRIGAEEESALAVELQPITNTVVIRAFPEDAELYIDGKARGPANQSVELLAASQKIEIRREGYVPYETEFVSRPGLEQQLQVTLKTLEQQRLESIKPEIVTAAGQTMKLLRPGRFTMGASRREAGRQANEMLRDVSLTRPYYLSTTEVTNAQFREFDAQHSSGLVEGHNLTLSNNNQPVVRVSWQQAARYCNWLSEREGLPPFYRIEDDQVVGWDTSSTGYRLPTEVEWAWAARVENDPTSLLKFPWGAEMPPPANQGNYADLSAASLLGRIISNYEDGFVASAPVASFAANAHGIHDLGGNVAEWTNDFYGASGLVGGGVETDPMGPEQGNYHVIRGSSWAHGTLTELRLSYRDYGDEPRDDVGFRIARYLE